MPLQGQYMAQSYLNPFRTDKDVKAMHFYIAGNNKSEWKESTNLHFWLSYNWKKTPLLEEDYVIL